MLRPLLVSQLLLSLLFSAQVEAQTLEQKFDDWCKNQSKIEGDKRTPQQVAQLCTCMYNGLADLATDTEIETLIQFQNKIKDDYMASVLKKGATACFVSGITNRERDPRSAAYQFQDLVKGKSIHMANARGEESCLEVKADSCELYLPKEVKRAKCRWTVTKDYLKVRIASFSVRSITPRKVVLPGERLIVGDANIWEIRPKGYCSKLNVAKNSPSVQQLLGLFRESRLKVKRPNGRSPLVIVDRIKDAKYTENNNLIIGLGYGLDYMQSRVSLGSLSRNKFEPDTYRKEGNTKFSPFQVGFGFQGYWKDKAIPAGEVTFETAGGQVHTIYLPPMTRDDELGLVDGDGKEVTGLFVGKDGSTYYDFNLTKPARLAPVAH